GEEGWAAQRSEMDNDFNPVIGSLDSLASSVSKIIDDSSEDEEERRKRIEAEENANNLGAVLGTIIGLASEAIKPDTSQENEITDYYEPEDEDFGFTL
ncbi:MAG: hypothetical protein K6F88_09485, partial [Ruminococcus sp.]|nr:hypothetical protein [Ruminococcus sp.]